MSSVSCGVAPVFMLTIMHCKVLMIDTLVHYVLCYTSFKVIVTIFQTTTSQALLQKFLRQFGRIA